MYALHPGTLPPESPTVHERVDVTAEDLMLLYGITAEDCIVWDPTDGYDYLDFIHLYPSYYDRYTLRKDGTPENDVPCGSHLNRSKAGTTTTTAGGSPSSRAGTSTRAARSGKR